MADHAFRVGDVVNLGAANPNGKIIQITKPLGSYEMYTVHTYTGEIIKVAKHQLVKSLPDEDFDELRPASATETSANLSNNRETSESICTDEPANVTVHSQSHENEIPAEVLQELMDNSEFIEPSRFASVNVDNFIAQNENKNTKRKTVSHMNLLQDFLVTQNELRNITDIHPENLDILLAQFFVSVRQKNGSEYEPTSLRNMLSSFERELRNRQYGESLVTSIKFAKTRAALKSKQKDLKKSGLGNKSKICGSYYRF